MIKKYIKKTITNILICSIIFLSVSIFCNFSNKNLLWFKNNLYNNTINFTFFNKIYKKYINKYIPFDIHEEKVVMNDKLVYLSKKDYLDGVKLEVGNGYNINTLCGGIVVYIGDKDKLNNTVIIQGTDGIDYWYSNIENLSINLYDYIEKDTLLGSSIDDYIYLTFYKDGVKIDYNEFI